MSDNGFSEWGGYMSAKRKKLEEQFASSSEQFKKSNLFSGISIFVNGHTNPSADELKRIMLTHGGIYHHYEEPHTKFIIASNLPDVKVRNMNTSNIISPQWVVDCVKSERILDFSRYLLYTNQKSTQPRLSFSMIKPDKEKSDFKSNGNAKQLDNEMINDSDRKNSEIFQKFHAAANANSNRIIARANIATNSHTTTARTAVDAKFLPEFFNNSRLHHIATIGAHFKQYIAELRDSHDPKSGFPALVNLARLLNEKSAQDSTPTAPDETQYIMHIDVDCFFVSVGLRQFPHLRGQPVAVTHSKGGANASDVPVHPLADRSVELELFTKRIDQQLHSHELSEKIREGFDSKMSLSEIASCSYEARAKGVRNGMFVGHAIKLCPELKTIPYDFEGYKEVAKTLYDTIAQYTLKIEAVSCDEMYVDLSDVVLEMGATVMDVVAIMRSEVFDKTKCPCSAGVGANKLLARMATKRAKPNGQFHLKNAFIEEYLAKLPAEDLPGVGSVISSNLKGAGIQTCGDLQRFPLSTLQTIVGNKHGQTLYQFCRGIDNRPLAYEQIRKSVSVEVNYGIRFKQYTEVETFLRQLCKEVHSRLQHIRRKTQSIALKLMVRAKDAPVETSKFMGHGVCDNFTKSIQLAQHTDDLEEITRTVLSAMEFLNKPPHELRGIGIHLQKLNRTNETQGPKANLIQTMFNKIASKQKEGKSTEKQQNLQTSNSFSGNENQAFPDVIDSTGTVTAFKPNSSPKKRKNIFALVQNEKRKQKKQPSLVDLPPGIDADVFASLPKNIQQEILNNDIKESAVLSYQLEERSQSPKDLPGIPISIERDDNNLIDLDIRPSTSVNALEELGKRHTQNMQVTFQKKNAKINLRNQNEVNSQNADKTTEKIQMAPQKELQSHDEYTANLFLQPNRKGLLLELMKSDSTPQPFDIALCCDQARTAIRENSLSDVYDSLMYMRKLLFTKHVVCDSYAWCEACRILLNAVNAELSQFYPGRTLMIPDTIQLEL